MVTTRRNKAAPAEPTQATAAEEQSMYASVLPTESRARPKRTGRKLPATQPESQLESQTLSTVTATSRTSTSTAATTATTAATTTTTTRRLRSKPTASPLKSLDEPKRNLQKTNTQKEVIPKPSIQASKRKRNTPRNTIADASATPEPEPAQPEPAQDEDDDEDEQGIFFTQNFGIIPYTEPSPEPSPARPDFITGDESALALLHRIESAAKESRFASSVPDDCERETHMQSSPQDPEPHTNPNHASTPQPIDTPSGFLSRSFSAIKSRLGFATPPPVAPSPAPCAVTSTRAPRPNTITESLSTPPTPIGERSKAPPRKKKQSPMFRLLTKGVEPNEMPQAEKWAKYVIPTLKNDADFIEKRKRLETPVLIKDLDNFPSCKPWETGFGDPLGEMDDDDVVPVWAVYLDMLIKEEEPKAKKHKASHEVTMDIDDTLSLNEMFATSNSEQKPPKLHDSHGQSASIHDLHPRRSIDPSPMFGTPASHQQGQNIFREHQGHDVTAQVHAGDREILHQATKKVVPTHDPAHGSFGLDYNSDEEDTTLISETSDATPATPVWTQPPPPAPVPAHAPLPGTPVAEAPPVPAAQLPVDEVERQRQKLMKHTPAKPSRLREAFVPSPSLLSDAGNDSILIATPLPATDIFDDIPDAEDLGLTDEDWANVEALRNSAQWKAAAAANVWPDPILTYDSDEEGLSSE